MQMIVFVTIKPMFVTVSLNMLPPLLLLYLRFMSHNLCTTHQIHTILKISLISSHSLLLTENIYSQLNLFLLKQGEGSLRMRACYHTIHQKTVGYYIIAWEEL